MAGLSPRMLEIASLVPKSGSVCDIGCDHGFIGIYLLQERVADYVIATDLRSGPLENAKKNAGDILPPQLLDRISFRLGGGLEPIKEGEAQTAIIAGLGGEMIFNILREGNPQGLGIKALVLEPQSDHFLVRRYLRENSYEILDERMVREENKYYPIIFAAYNPGRGIGRYEYVSDEAGDEAVRAIDRFGPLLIKKRDELLFKYLEKEEASYKKIIENPDLKRHVNKYREISEILSDIDYAKSKF